MDKEIATDRAPKMHLGQVLATRLRYARDDLLEAIRDSRAGRRSHGALHLAQLVDQAAQILTLIAYALLAYTAYQMWLDGNDLMEGVQFTVEGDVADARQALFYVFAAALGGPLLIIIAALAIGFVYNTVAATAYRVVPRLLRPLFYPLVLLALTFVSAPYQDDLVDAACDLYITAKTTTTAAEGQGVMPRIVLPATTTPTDQ